MKWPIAPKEVVYKPRRDELAEKWPQMSKGESNLQISKKGINFRKL